MRDPDVLGTWLNGESFDSLVLRGTDPWLARGDAVFETVRVHGGRPMFLDLHRERLADSLAACALGTVADARLDHALAPALEVAAEQPWPCALRFTVASPSQADGDLRLVVVLSRYRGPDAQGYAAGVACTLVDVPHPGLGALGKSVSWQWSQVARRRARAAGFDEALIGHDARVVESDSAAVLWNEGGAWFTPHSADGPLPSVTLRALRRADVDVAEARATVERLAAAEAVCLLSSLRLAMGVARIDGVAYARCDEHAAPLRRLLLDAHGA